MSNLLKSKFFLGTLVVAIMFVGAFALNATKASAAGCTVTATLRVGATGEQVKCLQSYVGAIMDGSFGPNTKAKVMAWQTTHNLTADGIVGPMTRATFTGMATGCTTAFDPITGQPCTGGTLPAGCTSTAGYSPTTGTKCDSTGTTPTGPLAGIGTISDVNELSQYNNEEVGAGQKDIKVLGFDLDASDDGDVALNLIKVSFSSAGNASGDSDRLEDYVDTVSVWMGSTKVGSAKATDFTKESTGLYSKSITLNSGTVVKAGETAKFYVALDAVNNLDSGDIDSDSWSVDVENIRYTDGTGVVTTTNDYDLDGMDVDISFVSLSAASDTELKISTNNTPLAAIVDADSSSNTDDVVLLKGKLKLDGTSKVWLDELPVTFTATGAANIEAITGNVKLMLGTTEYTESVTAGASPIVITFNNLDFNMDAGSTVNFTVSADINDFDATVGAAINFDEGDTLKAELTTTNRAAIIAENSAGDQLTNSTEMTGSALGEVQTFRDTGINVVLVGSPTAVAAKGLTGQPDRGTYTITFDVTAFGGDMWIDGTKPTLTGTDGTDLNIVSPGTGTQDAVITTSTGALMTGTINTTSRFKIAEGETERFTITSVVTPTVAGGLYSVALASLSFNSADVDITDALPSLEYTTNLVDFVTPSVNLVLVN